MKSVLTGPSDWKFDETIAPVFVEHARKHIPNYESVTDKCARYCELNLNKDSKIIDVGCATGHTIQKLYARGFTNLHGVDNSKKMIDLAPSDIATYTVSDRFPKGQYDMILCNWTLHFIEDKMSYLQDIYDSLSDNGTIKEKQKRIENVMFIKSVEWYQQTLRTMGFEVNIIDADWCFTTFMCKK